MKVTVHFCKSEDLGGRILRLFLMSKWNHVAIQVGDAVYEAVSWGGVIRRPYSQFVNPLCSEDSHARTQKRLFTHPRGQYGCVCDADCTHKPRGRAFSIRGSECGVHRGYFGI